MQSLINSERSGLEMEIMEYRPHLHSTTLLLDCFSPLHGKTAVARIAVPRSCARNYSGTYSAAWLTAADIYEQWVALAPPCSAVIVRRKAAILATAAA